MLDNNLRAVQQWHLIDDISPMLNAMLAEIEKKIDDDMLNMETTDPTYKDSAIMACLEKKAVDKFRKKLISIVKRGKRAAVSIEENM